MSKAYLFYGTQLVEEFESRDLTSRKILHTHGREIYDGGYIHAPLMTRTWWRCDLTPVLLADVPTELRALALLLI